MRKLGLVLGLVMALSWCGRQTGIRFAKMSFDAARQQAQSEQKLLLTYFYTEW